MKSTFLLAVLATVAAASPLRPRAVFSATTFNDISIAGGQAGNAQQEALDKLAGLPTDLTAVEKADLDFLNTVNQVANDAEKGAFNTAISAATGTEADALTVSSCFLTQRERARRRNRDSFPGRGMMVCATNADDVSTSQLQRGKIKNKVLKLTATVLKLQAQQAQGQNGATKLTEEQTKLDKNIALDVAEAGNPSTSVQFDGTIG